MLNKFFSKNFNIEIYQTEQKLILYPKTLDVDIINKLIIFMNNMGWFISSLYKNNTQVGFDSNDFDAIRFEPKFDMEYKHNSRYLYHVTEENYLNKIFKIGLVPKTKSKKTYHPERIYFTINADKANEIKDIFSNGYIEKPIILKIDVFGLENLFYVDKNFTGGVYTLENVPPKNISLN